MVTRSETARPQLIINWVICISECKRAVNLYIELSVFSNFWIINSGEWTCADPHINEELKNWVFYIWCLLKETNLSCHILWRQNQMIDCFDFGSFEEKKLSKYCKILYLDLGKKIHNWIMWLLVMLSSWFLFQFISVFKCRWRYIWLIHGYKLLRIDRKSLLWRLNQLLGPGVINLFKLFMTDSKNPIML